VRAACRKSAWAGSEGRAEVAGCEASGLPRPGSDDGSDNKGHEQRASGSRQVPEKERVWALMMRPHSYQDPDRCRRGQPTGHSPRYRLRRTWKTVLEWLALSAGPGKTRCPVVRGRGGTGTELLDGNSVTAPPCYPAGPVMRACSGGQPRKWEDPQGDAQAAGDNRR